MACAFAPPSPAPAPGHGACPDLHRLRYFAPLHQRHNACRKIEPGLHLATATSTRVCAGAAMAELASRAPASASVRCMTHVLFRLDRSAPLPQAMRVKPERRGASLRLATAPAAAGRRPADTGPPSAAPAAGICLAARRALQARHATRCQRAHVRANHQVRAEEAPGWAQGWAKARAKVRAQVRAPRRACVLGLSEGDGR